MIWDPYSLRTFTCEVLTLWWTSTVYDFEIAGSDGTAEDLAFYVWREPGGEWIGGMGGYE
ncbi:MAG: hypothetical protein IKI84_09055 [Clostridia bacterium]|nr:hypothetical protein [Clostridia bacterium]